MIEETSYQNSKVAKQYLEFTNSENGKIQQEVIFDAIAGTLSKREISQGKSSLTILDAGCGGGWLTAKLSETLDGNSKIMGCDFSKDLISYAKETYPQTKFSNIEFEVTDITSPLPYTEDQFDVVIFNMAGHDVSDLPATMQNLSRVCKPNGKLLVTIANPYYAFPVGVWKRGLLGVLFKRMPKLILRPYFEFTRAESRKFLWNHSFPSYFYTVPEYINTAKQAKFSLEEMRDLETKNSSENFDLRYRLFHFPMLLFMVFKKTLE